MVLTVFACNSVDKVTELAAEPCPKPRTHVPQNLNLMGGEKVNREQRLLTGSVRRVDVRGSRGGLPGTDKGLSEMTLVYIYLPLEQKHIVGREDLTDKSGSGKQSV